MPANWYVLHSKPNKEEFLCDQLLSHDLESFCPHVRVQVVNPRARKVRPYFPGYVFVRADLDNVKASSLDWMPGATGLVAFDAQPADVPDGLLQAIRRRVEEINAAGGELLESLKPGETVIVQDGPFAGYEAIFDARLSGLDRVRVFLRLLQHRQVPLELYAGQIREKTRH
jgi:transcription antitermination factor NusG